ncbi:MAG TPA: EamA family transporter [Patescibacteria group bacterium]|nr:EamA family transporter [Patescibacteria group bacterium]
MYIVYGLMCLIFGTTFLGIKIGVDAGAPPFLFAGSRFFFAGVVVLLAVKLLKGSVMVPAGLRRDVMLVGICMTGIMFGCLYWGERYVSSSVAALLAATTPIMIGVTEWVQGVRDNTRIKVLGLLLSFAGVCTAILPALGMDASQEAVIAVIVILAAEGGSVYGTMIAKTVLNKGVSPFVLNGWQMLTGGMLLMLLSLFWETQPVITYEVAASWAYLVILGSLGGHGAYYWLVYRSGPLLPSTWTYISPVIAQFVGYIVLAEYLSFYSLIGVVLVLGGIFLVSRAAAIDSWLVRLFKQKTSFYSD